MNKLNKPWIAVVAASLLLGTLVGVVWARPNQQAQTTAITRKVTLSPADFIERGSGTIWTPDFVACSGICTLTAPVNFPCLTSVTVERIRLHIDDPNLYNAASASLYRTYPPKGKQVWLGEAQSPDGDSGGLRTYSSPAINKKVWPRQKAWIFLTSWTDIKVYGVTVEYHPNT